MKKKNSKRTGESMDKAVCDCKYCSELIRATQAEWQNRAKNLGQAPQPKAEPKVYNTTVDVKAKYFDDFAELIKNQFGHGASKYAIQGLANMEATDVISAAFGGASQFDWVLGNMMKYIFRYKNFGREKDLLKIATYCYLLWIKAGFHVTEKHDTDTSK